MKVGDTVFYRPFGDNKGNEVGLLLEWWEVPGDEERSDEIYWKVLMNGKINNIKGRHLQVAK